MFSVSVLSRYIHSPTKQNLGAAKRVLRYVAGTVDFGIWYSKDTDFSLNGYSDSDWARSIDDRKSTSGNVFSLGSGAISWCSKKQDVVALSSAEAEYVAVTSAAFSSEIIIQVFFSSTAANAVFMESIHLGSLDTLSKELSSKVVEKAGR
ncbi:secreted RxLR effector protein 161-like [Nicotiana tomentosiformis]|uniref:secreted RxLR effector protein 161-like n=1 Tax=Nicotiana tomentosiformis TaxID=4098 RepID=UPI00388C6B09